MQPLSVLFEIVTNSCAETQVLLFRVVVAGSISALQGRCGIDFFAVGSIALLRDDFFTIGSISSLWDRFLHYGIHFFNAR